MKAIVLVRTGKPEKAFEIREVNKPAPVAGQVLIKVEGFGLNFADVMARLGLYADAPPLPSVIGYDIVGHIVELGEGTPHLKVGQRVIALTKFGGYAEYAVTDARALVVISDDISNGVGVALATQYCTAYFCTNELVSLQPGNQVLIHAAAGGVGSALVQLAKLKGCIIYGTASSEKLEFIKKLGVDYPIDYQKQDFKNIIQSQLGNKGLDVVFDSIGGSSVKKGYKLLGKGGQIVCFGAASLVSSKGDIFKMLKLASSSGLYSPLKLMKDSKSILGVNMLQIAENKPELFQSCLNNLYELYKNNLIHPVVGGSFNVSEIADAHHFLESRNSLGKIVVNW